MVALGPRLSRLAGLRGSAGLGVLFGLNIPACAAPLLLALFAAAAAQGATGATLTMGFVSLALFGAALSLPLVAAVLVSSAHRTLDWIGGLSGAVVDRHCADRPRFVVDRDCPLRVSRSDAAHARDVEQGSATWFLKKRNLYPLNRIPVRRPHRPGVDRFGL